MHVKIMEQEVVAHNKGSMRDGILALLKSSGEFDMVADKLYNSIDNPHRYVFILTGLFGGEFLRWMNKNSVARAGYILFPGGLRNGKVKAPLFHHLPSEHWMDKVLFVDDIVHTRMTIMTAIHQLMVPKDLPVRVIYDCQAEESKNTRGIVTLRDWRDDAE